MKISKMGVSFICGEENFEPKPYNDQDGNASLAYGTLLHRGAVTPADWARYGKGITPQQGMVMFQSRLSPVESFINLKVQTQLNQNQFDALASFVYNVGQGNVEKGTLLEKLNASDFKGVEATMLEYDETGGKVSNGLMSRREKEVELFNTPVTA